MDNRNVPKVIQTLVHAKQSIKKLESEDRDIIDKFWKEIVVTEWDLSLIKRAALGLEAWQLEWHPDQV